MQDNKPIQPSGTFIGRDVNTEGADFVGHDKYIYGDQVHGNKVMGDQITGDSIEGVGIAIGKGASVQIYGNIHYYPIKLHAPLRKVFDPLIENLTELFGGRQHIFARIAEFIENPQGGYLVITAPAGFGKTALLANLVNGTPTAFAYHFFTPLYGDSSLGEDFFLRNVVEQMAQWHGYEKPIPTQIEDLRALYQQLIAQPLERTQILIIDGLDEVIRWKLSPYLSRRLPAHLHIIVSIRAGGQDWQTEYKFPINQLTHLPLDGLDRDEVVDILRAAGGNAATFAATPEMLDKVMRVAAYTVDEQTGADPFYIRLLAEDITEGKLNATNIVQQPQGLEKYLDAWWQQVKQLAGEQPARDLFGTLTITRGLISRVELETINPSLVDEWAKDSFNDILRQIKRWVVGDDESGYALAHPRLREYMYTRINADFYLERLLAYCANWQSNNSRYALFYYSEHLFASERRKDLYTLIDKPWMNENFSMSNSHYNFIWDVEQAIKLASKDSSPEGLVQLVRACLLWATLDTMINHVPEELYRMLVQVGQAAKAYGFAVSMKSPERQSLAYLAIAEALLASADQSDKVKFLLEEALESLEESENGPYRMLTLPNVVSVLAQLGEIEHALQIVEEIELPLKTSALHLIVQALVQAGDIIRARQIVETIEDDHEKAPLLRTLIQVLAKVGAIEEALQVVGALKDSYDNVNVLIEVAKVWMLAGKKEQALQALNQVWQIANSIDERISRAEVLTLLAETLIEMDEKEKSIELISYAMQATEAAEESLRKTWALCKVASMLVKLGKNETALEIANGVLKITQTIYNNFPKTGMLLALMQGETTYHLYAQMHSGLEMLQVLVQVGQLDHALKVVEIIEDEQVKTQAFIEVVKALVQSGQKDRALQVTEKIKGASNKAKVLSIVAGELIKAGKKTEATEVANHAVQAAEVVGDEESKDGVLGTVAETLAQHGKIDEACHVANRIQRARYRTTALSQVAQALACVGKLKPALEIANTIQNRWMKVETLSEIVMAIVRIGKTNDALQMTQAIKDVTDKALIMSRLTVALSEVGDKATVMKCKDRVLKMTRMIKNENARSIVLVNLVIALVWIGEKASALEMINYELQTINEICDSWNKVAALSALIPPLTEIGEKTRLAEITNHALQVAQEIKDPQNKVRELAMIAQALAHSGDETQAQRVINIATETAEQIFEVADKIKALSGLAEMLAQTSNKTCTEVVTDCALQIIDKIGHKGALVQAGKADILARVNRMDDALQAIEVIRHITSKALGFGRIAHIMEGKGQHALAEQTFRTALTTIVFAEPYEGVANRDIMFFVLTLGVKTIAALDQGQTLWQVYKAIMEVESWWNDKSFIADDNQAGINIQLDKKDNDSSLIQRLLELLNHLFKHESI